MYLKSIEVFGFKSFAQKINFEFHNGITGIVGPNGSGKSNVADAVRWVLGEQSARQLRGGNMTDVIFSGTEARKPLSYAAVAITLDNSDHQLPVDYQEVTVMRRIYRSGESEYLINGTNCRLKDVNELFYDTGIGKEGYSIIGQGQIDKILSGRPDERRELFDEAAGIVKFKRRKATTIKKLEEEQKNLVRITDILSELERQMDPLHKQAETAKVYLAKREMQKELDMHAFLLEQEHLDQEISVLEQNQNLAESHLLDAKNEWEYAKKNCGRMEEKQEDLERRIEELRTKENADLLQKQQMLSQIELLKEQISAGLQNIEHYKQRKETIEAEVKEREKTLVSYRDEKENICGQKKEQQKTLQKKEQKLVRITASRNACSISIEEGNSEIIEILNARATVKGNAQRYTAMKEQVNLRRSSLNQKKLNLKSQEAEQAVLLEEAQSQYQKQELQKQAMETEEARLQTEAARLQETLRKQNAELETLQSTYHKERSRLETLLNLAERYEGYGNSIRRVMEQKEKVPGIYGVVADLIQVDRNYETAIETALGGSIQNVVTDQEETAKKMIAFLKREKYGRATFLPLTAMKGRQELNQKEVLKEEGVLGIASRLVHTDPQYEDLMRYLLGRVLVVDTIDHAIFIARKYKYSLRIVTLEGELLNAGGSMTGGAFKNNSNLLGRRREIEELETKVDAGKIRLSSLLKSIDANRSTRHVFQDTIADIREKLQTCRISQNTVKLKVSQLEEKQREIQKEFLRAEQEQQDIAQQIKELDTHNEVVEKELHESNRNEKELNRYLEEKQKELEEYRKEESKLTNEVASVRLELSSLEQKEEFQKVNAQRIQRELGELEKEKILLNENLEESKKSNISKKEDILKIEEKIQTALHAEKTLKEQLVLLQQEKEEAGKQHKEQRKKREDLQEKMNALDKECFRLKSQLEKYVEAKEKLISYLWEEYELTPGYAASNRKETYIDLNETKKQLGLVKEEIRKLGNVNVNAIEDYKETAQRYEFLSGQYQDLIEAEKTLKEIIVELDEGMKKQFAEKFQEIQKEFDKVFKELFGGGKGTLRLSDETDLLESGIEIISQPPGKKLQNMMQLSGGEKALSAISLLFAIQNLKPSPFCLLDEIEAALDDSNVIRFAKYLEKLTKSTQFIIITHRRGTMNAADRLYGITMQEKGVSALVSVDLVENSLTK